LPVLFIDIKRIKFFFFDILGSFSLDNLSLRINDFFFDLLFINFQDLGPFGLRGNGFF
jgi:hypothetical protein